MDEHTIRLTEAERIAVIGGGLVGVELVGSSRRLPTTCCASIRALRRDEVKHASSCGGEVLGIVRGMQTLECLMSSITYI